MPATHRRPRVIDTSMHFCPHEGCEYRGWLGLGNLRANSHPSGGPWRQFHCRSCQGYFLETHGTIFYGKHLPVGGTGAVPFEVALAAARLDGFELAEQDVLPGPDHHGADDKNAPPGFLPGFVDIGVESLAHGRAV